MARQKPPIKRHSMAYLYKEVGEGLRSMPVHALDPVDEFLVDYQLPRV